MRLLNNEKLLSDSLKTDSQVEWYQQCSSTMELARNWAESGYQQTTGVFLAEIQTDGRGRNGRKWSSAKGNLQFTIVPPVALPIEKYSGFSLVIGLAIIKSLPNIPLKLKWPNDIYFKQKKVGGILIELISINQVAANPKSRPLIGIGLNTSVCPDNLDDAIQLSLSYQESLPKLAANIITNIDNYIKIFLEFGFSYFQDEYTSNAEFLGANVTVITANQEKTSGIYQGVDSSGALVLNDSRQKIIYHSVEKLLISKEKDTANVTSF